MLKKSSVWLVVLISIMSIAFIATGCAKKQVVKEEAAAKPGGPNPPGASPQG